MQKEENGKLPQKRGGKGGVWRGSTTHGGKCGCDIIREALVDYGYRIFVIYQILVGSAGTGRPIKGVRGAAGGTCSLTEARRLLVVLWEAAA